jgi:hypothetical protein
MVAVESIGASAGATIRIPRDRRNERKAMRRVETRNDGCDRSGFWIDLHQFPAVLIGYVRLEVVGV